MSRTRYKSLYLSTFTNLSCIFCGYYKQIVLSCERSHVPATCSSCPVIVKACRRRWKKSSKRNDHKRVLEKRGYALGEIFSLTFTWHLCVLCLAVVLPRILRATADHDKLYHESLWVTRQDQFHLVQYLVINDLETLKHSAHLYQNSCLITKITYPGS